MLIQAFVDGRRWSLDTVRMSSSMGVPFAPGLGKLCLPCQWQGRRPGRGREVRYAAIA